MSLIWAILIGIAAGWLAGQIMKGKGFGLIGDLIIGVIGSVIGHWLFHAIGLNAYGLSGSLIVSTTGAIILLFFLRLIRSKS